MSTVRNSDIQRDQSLLSSVPSCKLETELSMMLRSKAITSEMMTKYATNPTTVTNLWSVTSSYDVQDEVPWFLLFQTSTCYPSHPIRGPEFASSEVTILTMDWALPV